MPRQSLEQHRKAHAMDANEWDERYAGTHRLFSDKPDETLVELAGDLTPGRALDLGAGEGRNSLWLARKGWDVTAIDLSGVALERLADQARDERLSVTTEIVDSNEFLARGGRFDLLVIANVHPEPAVRAELFARASAALAPGGHLFLVGHHISCLGVVGPPHPERLYTEEMLETAFPDLEVLRLGQRKTLHGDTGRPTTDVVVWAVRPAGDAQP